MDARDQLRRYLEQRRELGETELVLDGMTVEETLRILGAQGAGGGGREATSRLAEARRETFDAHRRTSWHPPSTKGSPACSSTWA